ncbi:MAG: AraC family transcriptional regulator [Chitinophagaceae bacterium]
MMVHTELKKLGLLHLPIELGEVKLTGNISPWQRSQLRTGLLRIGLDLIEDKRTIVAEKIKCIIINMVHNNSDAPEANFSAYLSKKLLCNYSQLSADFSMKTGTTIEHYIISHKIEKAKELLLDDELNLTEISFLLHYSSVAHLSAQFKKVTGLTPTDFKKLNQFKRRIALDKL